METQTCSMQSSLRVMLVDDDPIQISYVSALLNAMGIADIVSATEARLALQMLNADTHKPDLLLCDLLMPEMDGFELLSQLAKNDLQIPIVIVSGQHPAIRNSAKRLAQFKALNYLGGLEKPINMPALRALIDQLPAK